MLQKFRKGNQKGFTLIELLIVVAIIGILAAIAIPQFSAYRQRAYNSAGQSDLRNFKTAMEADFADNQQYQVIADATFNSTGTTATVTGILSQYKTSTNVDLLVDSEVGEYAAVSSHLNGDRVFGSSSNESVLYRLVDGKTVGVAYATAPASDLDFSSSTAWDSL